MIVSGAVDIEKILEEQRLFAEQHAGQAHNARNDAEATKTQFLTLLVAQMKNQDPMNPVDNQDFVAQLAQFSSLEQLITINEGVEKLVDNTKLESKMTEIGKGVDYIASLLTYLSLSPSSPSSPSDAAAIED